MCDRVLCGNTFLANVCEQWHQSVHVLPTGVDTDRYCIAETQPSPERPVIGWSGSSAGAKYLLSIEASLATVLERNKRSTLRVVSDIRPEFRIIPDSRIEYIRWSPTNEVRTIQEMTVGLMPLDDSQWSRGKCSYKMLLYMSCGRPVVVSPVGMNAEVLCEGEIGYGARTHDEWVDAIEQVLADNNNANRMGQIGRGVVVSRYSLHTLAPQLVGHFRACLNN
jgi:glycosyltransferase involved in cell wall biosynthesis